MASSPRPRPASEQRASRVEARLAIYARYATLLGEEMAAAWSADPERAALLTRELARARAELAEQYDELRGWPDEASPTSPDGFGAVLAGAVLEADQQRELEAALRARLEALRPGLALPAPAMEPEASDAESAADEPVDGIAPFGGALVAARSSGVGGVLGGQFPGVVAGTAFGIPHEPKDVVGAGSEGAPPSGGVRLDVRF